MKSTGMLRLVSLTIFIDITLSVVLEDTQNFEINSTSFNASLYPPVEGDLRFGGSSSLFFLHLLKHKLHKLNQLQRIQTTTASNPGCLCVPYYLCDINNNIILTGSLGTLDLRSRACTGNFEVCCFLRIIPTTMRTIMTMPMTPPRPTMMPMTPPRPTMMPMTPPRPTMMPMTPPRPTMMPMTPPRPTMMPMTPPRPTMMPMTPPRPTLTPPRPTLTPPRPTVQPTFFPDLCYCVYTFQCVNGYLIANSVIQGTNVGNPRQNQVCIQANQICCRIFPFPNVTPSRIVPTVLPVSRFPSLDPRPNAAFATLPTWPQIQVLSQTSNYPNFTPGQTCLCIPTIQCNVLGYIPISGSGSFNPLFGMNSLLPLGSSCGNNQESCCRIVFSQPSPQLLSADSQIDNPLVHYSGTLNACKCVHAETCSGENIVYPEGYETLDAGFALCQNEGEVCCRGSNFDVLERITANSVVSELGSSIFSENQCGFSSNIFAPGEPHSDASGKTYFAEFPWMVAILLRYPGKNDAFVCGGSMINSKVVLTAGHCMENRSVNNLIARFGEWDTKSIEEPLPFKDVEVETVITHPEFFNAALYHDVALLILKTPVVYSINIMPVCLPFQEQEFPSETRCYATGWGRSGFGTEGEYQPVLRKIDLPIINNEDCQNRLRGTRLGAYFLLHGSFICAGGEGSRDTCSGDGGGPLVCPMSTGQYVQAGIVSWGIECGTVNPAVYASVSKHRLWIDEQIANYGV